jgi:hypothetical protein
MIIFGVFAPISAYWNTSRNQRFFRIVVSNLCPMHPDTSNLRGKPLTEFSVGTYCRNLVILLNFFFVAGCVGWSVLDEESFEVARNFQ